MKFQLFSNLHSSINPKLAFTLLVFTITTSVASAQRLIASYPLKGGGEDVTLNHSAIRFYDGQFTADGLATKGIYKKSYIQTPRLDEIDLKNFTISVKFKADEAKTMPVFVLGNSCRLLNFTLNENGSILIQANNGRDILETEATYETEKWYEATLQYNGTVMKAYLDGQLIGAKNIQFSEQCMTTYFYGNQNISSVNFGNANCFAGTWRNLKVYEGEWTPKENNEEPKEHLAISWISPTPNQKTSLSHFELKAHIKSKQPLTGVRIYNNNHLIKSDQISNPGTTSYDYRAQIILHKGENRLVLHALTAGSDQREAVTVIHTTPVSANAEKLKNAVKDYELSTPETDGYYTATMCAAPDNGSYVAWMEKDTKMVHVGKYTATGQLENDFKLGAGRNVYAMTATPDGFALLMDEKGKEGRHKDIDWMFFVKYSKNGVKLVDKKLVGDQNFDQVNNMGACSFWSTPRLVHNGTYYYAVFGVFKKWDDGQVHQGDYLAILDDRGNEVEPKQTAHGWSVATRGWKWGTSHSFGQRLVLDNDYVHVMAKGDAYPRGVGYTRVLHNLGKTSPKTLYKKVIQKIEDNPGDKMYQYVHASLGDIIPTGDGAVLTSYASAEGRSSFDLAVNYVDVDGSFKQTWLTNTPGVDEHNVYMAEYGDHYLIAWTTQVRNSSQPASEKAISMAAIIDVDGGYVTKPFELDASLPLRSNFWADEWYPYSLAYGKTGGVTHDFQTYPNGDIGWVFTDMQTGKLRLYRMAVK